MHSFILPTIPLSLLSAAPREPTPPTWDPAHASPVSRAASVPRLPTPPRVLPSVPAVPQAAMLLPQDPRSASRVLLEATDPNRGPLSASCAAVAAPNHWPMPLGVRRVPRAFSSLIPGVLGVNPALGEATAPNRDRPRACWPIWDSTCRRWVCFNW